MRNSTFIPAASSVAVIQRNARVPRIGSAGIVEDGQLLRRFLKHRDEAAFEQIVARFGTLVFGIAFRTLRNRHSAEDVFQATFLILARRRKDSNTGIAFCVASRNRR
ncbi:MAG: sigma factor [Planctomycetaceae bacterium]